MTKRYFLQFRHSLDRISDAFYWPAIDLFIWGLTSLYLVSLSNKNPHVLELILTGVVLWNIIWRSQYEVTTNLMAEIWDRTIISVFSSPLKVQEWMASFMIIGIAKMLISLTFSATLAYILYRYNIFMFGFLLIPVLINLLLFGWVIGFTVGGILIRFGNKISTLAWAGVAVVTPFAALYYPVVILPKWAQDVASVIPPSHIFETLRHYILTRQINWNEIWISFALDIVYLLFAMGFFVFMFNKSRKLGFGRLI